MLRSFFSSNSGRGKSRDEGGFVKAMTKSKDTTTIVNNTDSTLYFRDKVGSAYGATRYIVPSKSSIEIPCLQHTFFRMLMYATVEDVEGVVVESSGQAVQDIPGQQNSDQTKKPKILTINTNRTIDSDELADNRKIEITGDGSMFSLKFTPR